MDTNLLLLHGALGSRRQMEDLSKELSSSFHIHTINFPGHGGRPLPKTFSLDDFAADTARYIRSNCKGPVDIFGYSMGGYVALLLAMKYPELVGRIVTLGTKFDWTPETAQRETLRLDPEKIREKVPDFAGMLQQRHAPQDWKKVVNKTKDLLMRLGNGEAVVMSGFKVPHTVHILRGTMDHMVTEEESVYMAAHLGNGRYDPVIGFRHPMEQVDIGRLAGRLKDYFQ